MATATETANQATQTVADQSKILADETVATGRKMFETYQSAYLAILDAGFQATNRWFEIGRVVLDQAEAANRETKGLIETLAKQNREQQRATAELAREAGQVVQNTWLGVYRNGRRG